MFSAIWPATNCRRRLADQQNQRLILLVQIEKATPATSKPGSNPTQHATIGPTMSRSRFAQFDYFTCCGNVVWSFMKESAMPRTDTTPTIPSDQDALLAREASRAITTQHVDMGSLKLQLANAGKEVTTVQLPEAAAKLLLQVLTELGNGRAVSVAPTDVEITTQQAADLLNVSRPYLVSLVEKGELPVRKVGNQRRLPLADVLEYKARNRANRLEALRELTALDQELGLR
jgi:excisionase family DNA binding protein